MFKVGQMIVSNKDWSNAEGTRILRKGKSYSVLNNSVARGVCVIGDTGEAYTFLKTWFEEIKTVGCDKMKYDHVSVGQFVIGSLHPESGWSMRPEPKTHQTEKQAKKECERLAKLEPTKKFVYLEIKGACQVSGVTWE